MWILLHVPPCQDLGHVMIKRWHLTNIGIAIIDRKWHRLALQQLLCHYSLQFDVISWECLCNCNPVWHYLDCSIACIWGWIHWDQSLHEWTAMPCHSKHFKHWGNNNMADIWQMIFFPSEKFFVFWNKCHSRYPVYITERLPTAEINIWSNDMKIIATNVIVCLQTRFPSQCWEMIGNANTYLYFLKYIQHSRDWVQSIAIPENA